MADSYSVIQYVNADDNERAIEMSVPNGEDMSTSEHINQFHHQGSEGLNQDSAAIQDEEPVIDIVINNVVSTFATRCHLNLRKVAMEGANVIFKRENGMVSMKMRRPQVTASIWSSGKITCTGATSEEAAHVAARRIARSLQHLGFRVRFSSFRVVNVLGTCSLPFGIRITKFSKDHAANASYEPELHPGVTYRIKEPKATLKIFSTGSITVTAPCVANVGLAIEHIYPLVSEYKMDEPETLTTIPKSDLHLLPNRRKNTPVAVNQRHYTVVGMDDSEEEMHSSDEDDFDSEDSQD